MPVALTDLLWQATGRGTTTSVAVTHPDGGGTTAGSTIIVIFRSVGAGMTPPAGWSTDVVGSLAGLYVYRLDNVGAAETSWTFTRGSAAETGWYMAEVSGLAQFESLEVSASTNQAALANGGTRSTNTTALNAGSNCLLLGIWASTKAAGGDTHSWSGYTNSFVEQVDYNPVGVAGQCIAVAAKAVEGQSTFECTATFATSAGTPSCPGMILVYRGRDADINAPLAYFTGFEFGTHGGLAGANGALGPTSTIAGTGAWGTNFSVTAGAARSGGHGLVIAQSANTLAIDLPSMSANAYVLSGSVKPVSGSGAVTALIVDAGNQDVWLMYDVATEKLGVNWNNGTTTWQTGTTPLGTWSGFEIRCKASSATYHMEWWLETGTGDGFQTSLADASGTAASSVVVRLGSLVSQTATFHYDDIAYTRHYGAWPLGVHAVSLLVPETTGASVSGTSGNFNKFTANGTLAAWASDAGALLDEVPPTISASSDGVVQNAVAASDYMEFPMTTLTLDPNEIIAGVRAVTSLWGGTGSGTGTLGFRGHDGLTETTFVAASTSFDPDSLTTASATYPMWYASMWSGAVNGAWTPTRLNAAALRLGFSTDATPDMGASAMYLEVATRTIVTSWVVHRLTDDEDPEVDAAVVTETLHPYNSAVRTFSVSNDHPTKTAEFRFYETGGAEHSLSPVVLAPTDPPEDVDIAAEAFGEIESTRFTWQ